ncbi:hypothetical protein BCR32DRAFT_294925 [Anaeromyces robustus]|uniref:L domain-like protein n=1 Tax=Anaeromyces robustus TaxID=1754192 RepID=A0A1Y1WZW4_9FUNG|nr:hypothetical protein BCR32DRAFT_294925 [Anaeromyces robustus]|eukprot:ORX78634.1 hypothetical protein BCR32DRAFT_294925 [Anaeromyces robustus]
MNIKNLLVILSSITLAASLNCEELKKKICSSCNGDNYQCKTDENNKIYSLSINNQNFSNGIPETIFSVTSLKELNLVNNTITSVPQKIEKFKKLIKLDISTNKLRNLPKNIEKLNNLKNLTLDNNCLESIPNFIDQRKIEVTFENNSIDKCVTLPVLRVETPDRVEITSKENWITNTTISISNAKNEEWNFKAVKTSIRGRGNTTWQKPKKPYAFKLDIEQSIMGMLPHKRWVLIANYLDNTFMRNDMAFYLSQQLEMDYTVHGDFVILIMNGKYQGLYWLGEAIKVDKNRVNINNGSMDMTDNEDKDYLIEMDTYFDEPVQFKSSIRQMPYSIKNNDYMIDENETMTTGGKARLERFQKKITELEKLLYPNYKKVLHLNFCSAPDESYTKILDIDSWAKFWLINEIMSNTEMKHPKSCYFTYDSSTNLIKAGPVWDFDWASLYKSPICTLKDTIYYNALFKSPTFVKHLKTIWNQYYQNISRDIENQIEFLRNKISTETEYDTLLWGKHNDPTIIPSTLLRKDFDAYVDFLKSTILNKLSVVNNTVKKL